MGVPYRESDSSAYYVDYFRNQRGGMPVFSGRTVMGGSGIGSVLSGLLRSATPLLKKGAVALGKRALTTGTRAASDVLRGANVKESLKRRSKQTVNDLFGDVAHALLPDASKRQVMTKARQKRAIELARRRAARGKGTRKWRRMIL